MLLKKLFRTLWHYKAQFISMVIMIALGVGVFLGFNIEWYSLEVNTREIYEATGFADYRIFSEQGFSAEDAEKVKSITGVKDATRFLSVNTAVKGDTDLLALTVSDNMAVSGVLLMEGEPYSETDPDGFWLSDSYAAANGIRVGLADLPPAIPDPRLAIQVFLRVGFGEAIGVVDPTVGDAVEHSAAVVLPDGLVVVEVVA